MFAKILLLSLLTYCCYAKKLGVLEEEHNASVDHCADGKIRVDDPERCDGYFSCVNGVAIPLSCPYHSRYDPVTEMCLQERCGVDFFCFGLKDGDYPLTDPSEFQLLHLHLKRFNWDCSKYVTCSNGKAFLRSCPGEGANANLDVQQFNMITNQCDLKEDAHCTETSWYDPTEICIDNDRVYVIGEDWRRDKNEICHCRREEMPKILQPYRAGID